MPGRMNMATGMDVTAADFRRETANGVTLVDFWAPWCGPCKSQVPIMAEVERRMRGRAKVLKCNVDAEQNVAAKYGVMSIPTLMIFKDGKEVERMVGLQSERKLLDRLEAVLQTCETGAVLATA